MRHQRLVSRPVVVVDGLSPREWMQAADVVVGQHRSRRRARRWANAIRHTYPGCTLAISRHRSGRWWLVAAPQGRVVFATVDGHLPPAEALGHLGFDMWVRYRGWS